ncbi:MAG: long-chain-acyl-CoA synthetase [Myxococcales bacterium]|nr:long-chain-acyl-CoA synthetase [Myxococcales bacterium]
MSARAPLRLAEVVRAAARGLPRLPGGVRAAVHAARSDGGARGSIGASVEETARRFPALPAIRFEDQVISYATLDARANRVARALRAAGVGDGSVVAVMMDARPEVLVIVTALSRLGAVAAMINVAQRGEVLTHSLRAAGSTRAIVGAEHFEVFESVRDAAGLSSVDAVWWVADRPAGCGEAAAPTEGAPASARLLGAEAARHIRARVPGAEDVTLGAPCFAIFTSGTTGLPKASIMTNMRWTKAAAAYGHALLGLSPGDAIYAPLPLYHNMGLTVAWGSAVATGSAVVLRRKFSASATWRECAAAGARALVYIGEMPRYLLQTPPTPSDRSHAVDRMTGVGLRPELWRPFKDRFGVTGIYETYAASEANTVFLNAFNIDGTVGFCPTPHAIVEFDVAAGEPVRDRRGRLTRVKGDEAGLLIGKVTERFGFDGYTDRAASERRLLRDVFEPGDVWFHSGDLLRHIGWGHYVFVDRVGDTFRWKSENVSTTEVERVLDAIPGVGASVVYGVEIDGTEGRAGMAAVTLDSDATPTPESLFAACRAALPAYAVPVLLRFRDALDTTETFKHQRAALRSEGFDLTRVTDRVYVQLPNGDVQALTPSLAASLPQHRW